MKKPEIIDVEYEINDIESYCKTCDYGARTVRDMALYYSDDTVWRFHMSISGSSYEISESDWILIICNAKSLDDIIEGVKKKLEYVLSQDWIDKEIYYEINDERTYIAESKKAGE